MTLSQAETEMELGEGMLGFRKALFGVRRKEVLAHIEQLNESLARAREVYTDKLEELKSANELLTHERNRQEQIAGELARSNKALQAKRDELLQRLEAYQSLRDQLGAAQEESRRLSQRLDNVRQMETENAALKKQLAETEAVNRMREQQHSQLTEEISRLKRQNKALHEGSLEDRRRLEAEFAEKRLGMAQLLEMHRYAMDEARGTLDTLTAQFGEAVGILSQIRAE